MKKLLLWLLLLSLAAGPVLAQVPRPGIYRVSKLVDYRPAAEYNHGVKTFTAPRHHPYVADWGVWYCLVAVDSAEHQLRTRLVFLAPPASPAPPLGFEGGFHTAADSTFSVNYGNYDGPFNHPPSNALRFFGTSFLLHDNAVTYDSGAGDAARPYVANDPGRRLTISPRNSLFALRQDRPYRTLLVVEADKAPFYAAPDTAHRGPEGVVAGQYVAILGETSVWYEAETVSPTGTRHHGWLWKPDLEKRLWVDQKAQTAALRFQVAYRDTLSESSDGRSTALAVRVISRQTGRVQQVIDSVAQDQNWDGYQTNISTPDCNFDGYPDLMFFAHNGGAGPNIGYNFYLYDPATRQFMYDADLSDLTQPEINPRTQTVSSSSRNSCCSHTSDDYRFINGQLTLVASHDETVSVSSLNVMVVTEGKLVEGKWREKTLTYRVKDSYPETKPPAKPPAKPRKKR